MTNNNKLLDHLILLSFVLYVCHTCDANEVNVRIKETVISGKSESFDGKAYNVFKGVPYAEPPVGRLRFRKPVPLRQWPKQIVAYDWPDPCYQHIITDIITLKNKNLSEDCLKLNIWTPGDSLTIERLRPVLFYIHGGALLWGAAHNSAEVLVTRGDIVFVDIQYRLSTFGFLYTGTEAAPGNMGLLDQALALEWVNDNIQYFGGDPQQITIMGLSAGSRSVSAHILSPLTRHLFRYAIMQSAAMTDVCPDGEEHKKKWLKGAEMIGCNEDNSDLFTEEVVQCMMKAEADKLQAIPELPSIKPLYFMPMIMVDGHFLPERPSKLFSSGDFKQNLSLMVSTAADEGSIFLSLLVDPLKYDKINPQNLSFDEAIEELIHLSEKMGKNFDINGEEVAKIYFNGMSERSDPNLLRRTIGIAFGDFFIQCPTLLFAKEVFRRSHHKSNVYQYYWNDKIETTTPIFAKWWGPTHTEDLPATFGMPITMKNVFAEKDREMSEKLIDAISNFVKTGTPGAIDGTVWPKYFSIDDHIVSPYYEFTSSAKPNTKFSYGLKINECEYLWRKYLLYN